jgi:ATP-dependent DNA helicase PIF1
MRIWRKRKAINSNRSSIDLLAYSQSIKSFFLNSNLCPLQADLNFGSDSYIAVASSGIAALLLHTGRTAHSTFKLPLNSDSMVRCSIGGRSTQADRIRKAKIIVWDEVSINFCIFRHFLLSLIGPYDAPMLLGSN